MTDWVPAAENTLPEIPSAGWVRVAGMQMEPRITDTSGNVARCVEAMEAAAARRVSLAVFPECALTGYCFADAEEARRYAVDPRGDALAPLIAAAGRLQVTAVIGYLERTETGIANTASVIGSEGILARYRKTHLPHLGVDRWVEAGCEALEPVTAAGLKTGVLICYDASFPEATRTLALRGAELVALPTNWPAEAVIKADWLPNARAYENVIYFAAINRIGTERGYVFHGRSRICGTDGETLAQGPRDTAAMLLADVDPVRARTKKIVRRGTEYWVDRIGHRRVDLYES